MDALRLECADRHEQPSSDYERQYLEGTRKTDRPRVNVPSLFGGLANAIGTDVTGDEMTFDDDRHTESLELARPIRVVLHTDGVIGVNQQVSVARYDDLGHSRHEDVVTALFDALHPQQTASPCAAAQHLLDHTLHVSGTYLDDSSIVVVDVAST